MSLMNRQKKREEKIPSPSAPRPLLLRAGNVTPPTRTPWGGTKLSRRTEAIPGAGPAGGGAGEEAIPRKVGESWEISVEPDFPSVLEEGGSLEAALMSEPAAWLGPEAAARGGTALLVKLLDAAEALSVQIHPSDTYAGLEAGESGKPESWYVIEADPGAGLYLGLEEGVTREALEGALAAGEDISEMLHFVPAEVGDFFLIEAGTVHAIGPGMTLVEPQRVLPGKRGVTYRYWDWNRRYDAQGREDPAGSPRPLHVRQALEVTRWEAPRAEALLSRIRLRLGPAPRDAGARIEGLCGPEIGVRSAHLRVHRLTGSGALSLPRPLGLQGLVVLEGTVRLPHPEGEVRVEAGRSAALPGGGRGASALLEAAHALLCETPASPPRVPSPEPR